MLPRAEVPTDLVATLVFLTSGESDFITGQTIAVDGAALSTELVQMGGPTAG